MKIALFCAAVFVGLLDLYATNRVLHSFAHSRGQKTAWILFIWLAPLIGAILALEISSVSDAPALAATSRESGAELWVPGIGPSNDDDSPGGHSV